MPLIGECASSPIGSVSSSAVSTASASVGTNCRATPPLGSADAIVSATLGVMASANSSRTREMPAACSGSMRPAATRSLAVRTGALIVRAVVSEPMPSPRIGSAAQSARSTNPQTIRQGDAAARGLAARLHVEADGDSLDFRGNRRIALHHKRIVSWDDMLRRVGEPVELVPAFHHLAYIVDDREGPLLFHVR